HQRVIETARCINKSGRRMPGYPGHYAGRDHMRFHGALSKGSDMDHAFDTDADKRSIAADGHAIWPGSGLGSANDLPCERYDVGHRHRDGHAELTRGRCHTACAGGATGSEETGR